MRVPKRRLVLLSAGATLAVLILLSLLLPTPFRGLARGGDGERTLPVTLEPTDKIHQPAAKVLGGQRCNACHLLSDPTDELAGLLPSIRDVCLACHTDQQQSLGAPSTHPPFVEKECSTCHKTHWEDPADSLVRPVPDLCLMCHADKREEQKLPSGHPPFVQGQCMSCHEPHGSKSEPLLKAEQKVLCVTCHKSAAADFGKQFLHPPFAQGSCTSCHSPHASEWTPQLKAPVKELCTSCHGGAPVGVTVTHPPVISGRCLSCHFPHASDMSDLFLRATSGELCVSCHRK